MQTPGRKLLVIYRHVRSIHCRSRHGTVKCHLKIVRCLNVNLTGYVVFVRAMVGANFKKHEYGFDELSNSRLWRARSVAPAERPLAVQWHHCIGRPAVPASPCAPSSRPQQTERHATGRTQLLTKYT